MSRYRAILQCLLAAGFCAVTGGAWAQQSDTSIKVSSPRDAAIDAALKQQLGDDTGRGPIVDPFRAPEGMPKSPLQGNVIRQNPEDVQMQPQPLTAHQRDLLQKKKDWVFMDPKEMISGPSEEEIFNLKGINSLENPDDNLTPMERFYQKQFEKKKAKDDDQQLKKADSKLNRDDDRNSREKSMTEALMSRITGQEQSFQPDTGMYVPKKKDNSDDSSGGYNDPFSSANYGPDAPASAQQARMDVYKKLYGLTTDSSPAPAQAASQSQTYPGKSPADTATGNSFYTQKAPPPVLGFLAPTAPVAPGKPTMNTVALKDDLLADKPNPLFVSPSTKLPKRPF